MDADRFDTLAKRLVTPTTRRATLGGVAAGSLLSALGLSGVAPEVRAAQANTCALAFVATVRLGPSVEQALTPGGSRPGELRGELRFSLSETGNLENGALLLPDGASLPVVGQATGHSLQVRIELGQRRALVAVGVGEQAVAACQGAIDGVATGPEVGDLGDWHAAVLGQTGNSGGASAPTPTPTPAPAAPAAAPAQCAPGLSPCFGVCVDLGSDLLNCGACGALCESSLVAVECRGGVCERVGCPVNRIYCGAVDGCRDLVNDPNHCGACQNPCLSGVCLGGICTAAPTSCPPGLVDCGDGECRDLLSDSSNCGSCGIFCPDIICVDGVCESDNPICPPGQELCSEGCADIFSDDFNCGVCGNNCQDGLSCQGGICVGPLPICPGGLPSGEDSCNGVCVDLQNDPANCGACFNDCLGNPCVFGVCDSGAQPCAAGLFDCGGVCVDLMSDASNCGECGEVCPQGPGFCVGGFCPQ